MKKYIIAIFLMPGFLAFNIIAGAQDCNTSALFKKGALLEYQSYAPKTGAFSSKIKFYESTKLTFRVDEVIDSAGATYSRITKTGTSFEREKNNYEKKYTLACRDGKIMLPVDFYFTDTAYLSDLYPGLKKKDSYHTVMNLKAPATQYFSTVAGKNDFGYVEKRYNVLGSIRDFGWQAYTKDGLNTSHYESSASLSTVKFETLTTIKKLSVKGKTKVDAGGRAYDAVRVEVDTENTFVSFTGPKNSPIPNFEGKSVEARGIIFYNETIGIIKTEGDKNNTAYFELIKQTTP